jgi:hypothetical protein
MIIFERCRHITHQFRVGNIGSLSWFATVHLELHVGFTSAYGLTLGFMILAFLAIVFAKQCYGMNTFLDISRDLGR